ncbi:MAG: hypothetical protein ABIK89_01235 [Planctomycetota bacterium]
MKKTSVLIGVGLGIMALLLTSSTRVYAQPPNVGTTPGGGKAQLGDTAVIITPAGAITLPNTDLVITGPAKPPRAVGTCTDKASVFTDPGWVGAAGMPTQVAFYDADVVPRTRGADMVWREGKPTGKTEVAIVFPGFVGFKTLQVGWHLGKNSDKGKCGPGYDVFYTAIIGGDGLGGVNMAFAPVK